MANRQLQSVSPRIARMLRELEGPPSGESTSGIRSMSGGSTTSGAQSSTRRRGLVRAVAMVCTAVVALLAVMQARAPSTNDDQAAAGANASPQHLSDAGRVTQ